MLYGKCVHIPQLSIKYNFHRLKQVDPPLAASEVRQIL